MKRAVLSAISVICILAGFSSTNAIAHDPDEYTFTGEAVESCVVPGESWSVEWIISNDDGANAFGIVDTSPVVSFSPLFDDAAPGEYIPSGESASAVSVHAYGAEDATLFVLHDVTTNPEDTALDLWIQGPTVDRPDDCPASTGTITIVKEANGAGALDFDFNGDLGNFNLDNDESLTWTVLPGSYLVNEIGAEGWHLVNIDCYGSNFSDTDIDDNDVSIELEAGDEAVCVFENEADEIVSTPTATPTESPTVEPTATPTTEIPQPQIIVVEPRVIVESPRITPPSTGTGGLLNGWGKMEHTKCFYYWFGRYCV